MAVALATVGNQFGFVNSGTSFSITGTTVTTGLNRVLILFLSTSAAVTAISADWDTAGTPQGMTFIGSRDTGGGSGEVVYFYGLVAPTSGNLNFTVSWTGTVTSRATLKEFTGCDQTGGITTWPNWTNGNQGNSDNIIATTGSITCPAGGALIGSMQGAGTITVDSYSGTVLYHYGGSAPIFRTQYILDTTDDLTWNCTNGAAADWGAAGCALAPVAAGGATPHGPFGLAFHGPFGGPV